MTLQQLTRFPEAARGMMGLPEEEKVSLLGALAVRAALAASFDEFEMKVVGVVALFVGRRPKLAKA